MRCYTQAHTLRNTAAQKVYPAIHTGAHAPTETVGVQCRAHICRQTHPKCTESPVDRHACKCVPQAHAHMCECTHRRAHSRQPAKHAPGRPVRLLTRRGPRAHPHSTRGQLCSHAPAWSPSSIPLTHTQLLNTHRGTRIPTLARTHAGMRSLAGGHTYAYS